MKSEAGRAEPRADPHHGCQGKEGLRIVPTPLNPGFVVGGWTGKEALLWDQIEQVGFRFHGGSETWQKMAPAPFVTSSSHEVAAISSGRFFVWDDAAGAAYDWAADTWSSIAPMGGPRPPLLNPLWIAVGTPTHLIYIDVPWAQKRNKWAPTLTGKFYDVAGDAWQPLPVQGAPLPALWPVAVSTDTELIVWGGLTEKGVSNNGARFDPLTATWRPMTAVDAPSPNRTHAAAVWTGKRLFVWGGMSNGRALQDGGLYDPIGDEWTPVTQDGAPQYGTGRAVWTGKDVIVTGPDTRIYNPSTNSWRPTGQSLKYKEVMTWDGCRLLALGTSPGYIYEPPADP